MNVYLTPIELGTLSSHEHIYMNMRGHSQRSDKETMSNAVRGLLGDINGHAVPRRFLYSPSVDRLALHSL